MRMSNSRQERKVRGFSLSAASSLTLTLRVGGKEAFLLGVLAYVLTLFFPAQRDPGKDQASQLDY